MASLFCTGPAHIFVSNSPPASIGSALYLGTCEESPQIEIHRQYEDVRNDIGGATRFDKSYQGELAAISLDINRFNYATYFSLIANRPRSGGVAGLNLPADRGTLVMTEGVTLALYILFQFGAAGSSPKAAFINQGLPAGYRFPYSEPVGPDILHPIGTRPKKIHVAFEAIGFFTPASGSFLLYDTAVTGLPPIN